MNNKLLRSALIDWMAEQDYRIFTTLAFNGDTSVSAATDKLKLLHARLDRLALGPRWQKLSEQRITSISFPENIESNLHFHMLWSAPKSEDTLFQTLPILWQEIVPAGDADMQLISGTDTLYGYCTKQMYDSDYILDGRT